MKRCIAIFLAAVLLCGSVLSLASCGTAVNAATQNLTDGAESGVVPVRKTDVNFGTAYADFALKLFNECAKDDGDKSTLISPLSVILALAMTAAGAEGKTEEEMQAALGGIPTEELCEYLYDFIASLSDGDKFKLDSANSIWFRDADKLKVNPEFLRYCKDYFCAEAYKSPFNTKTVEEINAWVDENTDGMIKKIIDELKDEDMLCLINALAFEAEWQTVYTKEDVRKGEFTAIDGSKRTVDMMSSEERRYISTDNSVGFIKNYSGAKYAFAVLLPDENVDFKEFVASLDGKTFLDAIKGEENAQVMCKLPKFTSEYSRELSKTLKTLGMNAAFDDKLADLTGMGTLDNGNLYIGKVLHKTFIAVDELGTKAGAVTASMVCGVTAIPNYKYVTLDRPFVYSIIDCDTGLPLFIGTVTDINK